MGFVNGQSESRRSDPPEAPPAPADERGAVDALAAFLESSSGSLFALADVYGDRLRATTRETIYRAGGWAVLGLAALLWVGSATLSAVRGLCGAVAQLGGGRPWLGDLAGGLIALALAAAALALGVRWSNRRELRALERKYAERSEQGADPAGVPAAPAGAGVAPAAGGAAGAR